MIIFQDHYWHMLRYIYVTCIHGQCCQHPAPLLFHYCLCSASTCVCTYLPAVTWPHFFVFFRLRISPHRYLLKCEKMRLLDQFLFQKKKNIESPVLLIFLMNLFSAVQRHVTGIHVLMSTRYVYFKMSNIRIPSWRW